MDLSKAFQNIFAKKEDPAVAQPKRKEEETPSPVILLKKEDLGSRELLTKKLEEYKGRLDPERPVAEQLDTIYKIAIVEELLEKGEVNTWVLLQHLTKEYDGTFDKHLLENARGVIEDYIKTGGRNLEKAG